MTNPISYPIYHQILQIVNDYVHGNSIANLANQHNVSEDAINQVLRIGLLMPLAEESPTTIAEKVEHMERLLESHLGGLTSRHRCSILLKAKFIAQGSGLEYPAWAEQELIIAAKSCLADTLEAAD